MTWCSIYLSLIIPLKEKSRSMHRQISSLHVRFFHLYKRILQYLFHCKRTLIKVKRKMTQHLSCVLHFLLLFLMIESTHILHVRSFVKNITDQQTYLWEYKLYNNVLCYTSCVYLCFVQLSMFILQITFALMTMGILNLNQD